MTARKGRTGHADRRHRVFAHHVRLQKKADPIKLFSANLAAEVEGRVQALSQTLLQFDPVCFQLRRPFIKHVDGDRSEVRQFIQQNTSFC